MKSHIEEFNDSFFQTVYRYCEGDVQKAEHFLDCSVNLYYYRMWQKALYVKWHNEKMKEAGGQ